MFFLIFSFFVVFNTSRSAFPAAFGARGRQYYVSTRGDDRNSGSRQHPWATLTHAAATVHPGDTVHVQAGAYKEVSTGKNSELQDLLTAASGTSTARIRYISDDLWKAIIVGSGTLGSAVWKNTGDYVDIVGFEIVGGTGTADGILISGAHVSVLSNKVHNIPVPGNNIPNGGSGITSTINYLTAIDNKAIGNLVYNIGSYQAGHPTLVHGIYWGTPFGTIQNNVVHKVQGFCIELNHNPDATTVINNTVFNCGIVDDNRRYGGGIDIGSQDFSPVDHISVNNNIIMDCPGRYAIQEMYTGQGTLGPHNTFRNNLLFRNAANFNIRYSNPASDTIFADPQFVNYKTDGTGDYRPKSSSVAVAGGATECASSWSPCIPLIDFRGAARPSAPTSDRRTGGVPQRGNHRTAPPPAESRIERPSVGAFEPSEEGARWPWY